MKRSVVIMSQYVFRPRRQIVSMKGGKSPGHDGFSIEHLKFTGVHLPRVLTTFFTLCVSHSYLLSEMLRWWYQSSRIRLGIYRTRRTTDQFPWPLLLLRCWTVCLIDSWTIGSRYMTRSLVFSLDFPQSVLFFHVYIALKRNQ
ncbi:hypothetical protein PYW08_011827 [Mythimna loreyi]|uniref:Uncharacterized protein n=1 Tax=Mythimna loreyi TaxID=667449 RepID=A0ACC2QLM2_9NEOP|nr:hypothetical protein PYW08_011827 [Mythimna loreyi]